jgi:hypothetical protein
MALLLLSLFSAKDANKATQFGFLTLMLSILPFDWYLTFC